MAGLIIFLYSLLRRLESQCGQLRFILTPDQAVGIRAVAPSGTGEPVVVTPPSATSALEIPYRRS